MPIQGEAEAQRHVTAFPVGAAVAVSYDPRNPENAVVRPGLRGCTIWVTLCLTPFVIVGLGMWVGAIRRIWSRPAFDPADPRQVATTDSGAMVVRPERRSWLAAFLTCLGIAAFLVAWTVFFVGFALGLGYWLFDGFLLDPPLVAPGLVWAVLIIGCALGGWRLVRRSSTLIVDGIGRTLRFSRAGQHVEAPFAMIKGLFVTEQAYPRRNGNLVRFRVELALNDGTPNPILAEYDDRRDAEALRGWLANLMTPATPILAES
jgi:hypothetical protein